MPSWKRKMMKAPSKCCYQTVFSQLCVFKITTIIVFYLGFVKRILIKFLRGVLKSFRLNLKGRDQRLLR